MDDVFVVVVAEASAQLLVIHLGFLLPSAPAPGDLVWIGQPELPAVARPRDDVLTVRVRQLFQQELPQLDRSAACDQNLHNTMLYNG